MKGIFHTRRGQLILLLLLFLVALAPRWHAAQFVGWGWDGPGTFNLVNYDEGGSCRAALDGFSYSPLIGSQTIALSTLRGNAPPEGATADPRLAKSWCQQPAHLLVARSYSAVLGALTVPVVGMLGWLLFPGRPAVGLLAAALLAVSGFHMAESHKGTVDAASVFFIYAFLLALVAAVRFRQKRMLVVAILLAVPAVWTKYWVFALLGFVAFLPTPWWTALTRNIGPARGAVLLLGASAVFAWVSNPDTNAPLAWLPVAAFWLLVPWRRAHPLTLALLACVPLLAIALNYLPVFHAFTTGDPESPFGTGYAAIGWHKWVRNPVNVVAVLIVGLGIPGFIALLAGIRRTLSESQQWRLWACLTPLLAFLLFMALLAPVTYYRHYLPLIPAALLLAAYGFEGSRWSGRPWALALFLAWPAFLGADFLSDYYNDPRAEARGWYEEAQPERVFMSFYVNPPPAHIQAHRLFRPEYAMGDEPPLAQAQYLVLSENWYDTAFANELNGPLVQDLDKLIKTRPEYTRFYRSALAGTHPLLERERVYPVGNFMPELVVHKALYGTFQMFVGDLVILRVRQ